MRAQTKMGILSLPREVLMMILEPLLRNTPERMSDIYWVGGGAESWRAIADSFVFPYKEAVVYPYKGGNILPNKGRVADNPEPIQLQILRVCRAFYEIGESLLYKNTLILIVEPMERSSLFGREGRVLLDRSKLTTRLRQVRNGRFKKVCFVMSSGYDRPSPSNFHYSGERFDKDCAMLAEQQPLWDKITVRFLPNFDCLGKLRLDRSLLTRWLSGLGRLHCKEAVVTGRTDETRDDLIWAMKQPERVPMLWPLYEEFLSYLDHYDEPLPLLEHQPWHINHFFRREAAKAVEEGNLDMFFLNLEAAVEYVKCAASQGLVPSTSCRSRFIPSVLERATVNGEELVNARKCQRIPYIS